MKYPECWKIISVSKHWTEFQSRVSLVALIWDNTIWFFWTRREWNAFFINTKLQYYVLIIFHNYRLLVWYGNICRSFWCGVITPHQNSYIYFHIQPITYNYNREVKASVLNTLLWIIITCTMNMLNKTNPHFLNLLLQLKHHGKRYEDIFGNKYTRF